MVRFRNALKSDKKESKQETNKNLKVLGVTISNKSLDNKSLKRNRSYNKDVKELVAKTGSINLHKNQGCDGIVCSPLKKL